LEKKNSCKQQTPICNIKKNVLLQANVKLKAVFGAADNIFHLVMGN
jgi:hypothetical protein